MKKFTIIVVIVLVSIEIQAQKLSFGIEAGGNSTVPLVISKYAVEGTTKLAPWFGYYIGGYAKYMLNEKRSLKFFVQGEKRSVHTVGGIQLSLPPPGGEPLEKINLIISNSYLNLGALYLFSLSKKVELGFGINNHILLYSTSYSKQLKNLQYPAIYPNISKTGRYKNEYFKTYLVSIPVQLIITIDRFAICPSLDLGLMNRINNSGGVYKQFEYTAQLGVSYTLKK